MVRSVVGKMLTVSTASTSLVYAVFCVLYVLVVMEPVVSYITQTVLVLVHKVRKRQYLVHG